MLELTLGRHNSVVTIGWALVGLGDSSSSARSCRSMELEDVLQGPMLSNKELMKRLLHDRLTKD